MQNKTTQKVIIVQPNIQHYRVPVFDRLRDIVGTELSIEVYGTMNHGEAIGGGSRDYFRNFPLRHLKVGKQRIVWWPNLIKRIRNEKPKIVISTVYPSNLSCWFIPGVCKSLGAVAIGWTKVQSPKTNFLVQRIKASLFRKYQYILAYGESSHEELLELGYSKDKIYVTNNTIDTDRIFSEFDSYQEKALELRQEHGLVGKRILLCIAKMETHKRHQDLFDAWPQLSQLDPDLYLVLIGSGELSDKIQRQARLLDQNRIRFVGRVPSGEDYNWVAAADATVQCGAVGLAINQSMAFGKPTVIADESGPDTESLIDGKTGFRYQKGNRKDLVAKVKLALSDDAIVKDVTENAREIIHEKYSIEHMVSKIQTCMLTALG